MSDITIGEAAQSVFGPNRALETVPFWPPDVFAVAATLLSRSGAYIRALDEWPPTKPGRRKQKVYSGTQEWDQYAKALGAEWKSRCVQSLETPNEVKTLWNKLFKQKQTLLKDLAKPDSVLRGYLVQLLAFADEACVGIGRTQINGTDTDEVFHYVANSFLSSERATLTMDAKRACVLPKMHTPQSGLTLRSFSHHLSLNTTEEIQPTWTLIPDSREIDTVNLLVIPWPFEVQPKQFVPVTASAAGVSPLVSGFEFFEFSHRNEEELIELVPKLLDQATQNIGEVNGVIFPELAVSYETYKKIRNIVVNRGAFLICGYSYKDKPDYLSFNQVGIDFANVKSSKSQRKHHRWKLDAGQLAQYGLAGVLSPSKSWWESIGIWDRSYAFFSISPNLLLSTMICEDLARPDPLGEIVRAVGPNLIVSLLMDGPQLRERWSGRYATVLADDPGSSVLSVTSLGMSRLSKAKDGNSRHGVVALWKDSQSGAPTEIVMPDWAKGLFLSLHLKSTTEYTADGRSDCEQSKCPILSSVLPVSELSKSQ